MEIGSKAPEFNLLDSNGKKHSLSDFSGKNVVLYFYPKDDTPGCTIEACEFRDSNEDLKNLDAVVIGISKDEGESHRKFIEKYNLNFLLLSNPDSKVIEAYESWGERKFMGKTYMGTMRNTFVIDKKGKIAAILKDVNPKGHSKQVIEELLKLK